MAEKIKKIQVATNDIRDLEDTAAVHLSTNDTISGTKQFTGQLAIPTSAPTNPQVGAIWVEISN